MSLLGHQGKRHYKEGKTLLLNHVTPLLKTWSLCEGTEVKHVTQTTKGVVVILLIKLREGTELKHVTPLTKDFEVIHHIQLYEGAVTYTNHMTPSRHETSKHYL